MKRGFSFCTGILTLFLIAVACAKISSPSGGPKDIAPPVVIKDVPANGSANYNGDNFIVSFNEYVVLDKIIEKFMVSPPLGKNPVIAVNGKNLVVEFDDELKENTTYTFYFEDAIRDLNENNPLLNYQFVFSTGPIVDSLSVTGNVYNALNLESASDLLVLLHSNPADSVPHKVIPTYITRVDKNGYFRINNVKEGQYKLYAVADANKNKLYDLNTEVFAFVDSIINITPASNYIPSAKKLTEQLTVTNTADTSKIIKGQYQMFAFTAPKNQQYMTSSARKQPFSLVYTFAMPLDTATFGISISSAAANSYFIEENNTRDTFKIWLTDSLIYSRENIESILSYPLTDSTGMLVRKVDTIPMRYIPPRETRGVKAVEKLAYDLNLTAGKMRPNSNLVITTQAPFLEPDTTRIFLFETADTIKTAVKYAIARDESNSCRYSITAPFREKSNYMLVIDSAGLSDIYGTVCDSAAIKFTVRDKYSYGSLTVSLTGYNDDVIVQLLDNNENIIQTQYRKGGGKVVFSYLENGTDRLRVIYDLNGDRKWTTGNYDIHLQPEPVSYYEKVINAKTNYDLQEDWDISLMNFKDQSLRKKAPAN